MSQVNPQPFNVTLSGASTQVLPVNSQRLFLQIQNLGPGEVVFKFDGDFTPAKSSIQSISFSRIPTTGSAVVMQGATPLCTIVPGVSAATLQGEVDAALGAGKVVVTGTIAAGFVFTFIGTLADIPQEALTIDSNTLVDETTEQSAVQYISWSVAPEAGTFTVTYDGQTTPDLPWDTDGDELKAALEALSSIGAGQIASVTYDPVTRAYSVAFGGSLAAQPIELLEVTSSATKTSEIASEVNKLYAAPAPVRGTFQLIHEGNATSELAFGASAGTIQAALEALPSIQSGNVTVTGSSLVAGFTITFINDMENMPVILTAYYPTPTPLRLETLDDADDGADVNLALVRTTPGAGPIECVPTVTTLQAGVTSSAVVVTVVQSQLGAVAPTEGMRLIENQMMTYDSSVPIGDLWMAANQSNTLATVWEG
jgi:hypothetical protein